MKLDYEIGSVIKKLRKSKKMTLQELSERSELSVSYLSMLERGLNSPTISSLQSICLALEISLTDLLTNIDNESALIRREDRPEIFNDHDSVIYHALTSPAWQVQAIQMDVYNDAPHMSTRHVLDELGYILSGSMIMTVEGIPTELKEGDSFYIPAGKEHHFRRTSPEVCSSLWIHYNPPTITDKNYILSDLVHPASPNKK